MSDFIIKNERNIKDGLCLIAAFDSDFIGLANITFCDKESTMQEYKEWENETMLTVLPLSDPKQSPQSFRHYRINRVENIVNIKKQTFEKNDYNLEEGEVVRPFLGGVVNDNFQELINRLWELDSDDIFEYKMEIENYYDEIFKKLEEGNYA